MYSDRECDRSGYLDEFESIGSEREGEVEIGTTYWHREYIKKAIRNHSASS